MLKNKLKSDFCSKYSQIWVTHKSLTEFLRSKFCGLYMPEVIHCHAHLPHMGLPMDQNLVKCGTNWVQTLRKADL